MANIFIRRCFMDQDNNKQKNDNQEAQAPAIIINNQYIKDFSLEIPFAPEIFNEIKENPEININVDVNANKLQDNVFNVDLVFSISGDVKEKKLFVLELTYSAVVQINVPQEHLEPVLLIEIPRMLFPFARNIITTSLMNAGLPPFMINPIDFVAMYNNRAKAN